MAHDNGPRASCSCSSRPRASGSLMSLSEPEARGPEDYESPFQQIRLQPFARLGVEAERLIGEGLGAAEILAHDVEGRFEVGRARLDDGGAGVDVELGIAADM